MNILMLQYSMEKILEFFREKEELEAKKGTSEPKIKGEPSKEEDGFVSIHAFEMMSNAYDAKFDECEKLKAKNRELTVELSKYRYFIECQRNEIEKL